MSETKDSGQYSCEVCTYIQSTAVAQCEMVKLICDSECFVNSADPCLISSVVHPIRIDPKEHMEEISVVFMKILPLALCVT